MTMLRHPSTEMAASGSASSPAPSYPRFIPVGDAALTIEFGNEVALELNDRVITLDIAIAAAELDGIIETVPSYRSLLVCYDPLEITYHQLIVAVRGLLSHDASRQPEQSTAWNVPVLYEPPFCDDLPEVAQRLGLTEQQVIDIHTAAEFRVYTIGYAPGMPYLGRRARIPASLAPRSATAAGVCRCRNDRWRAGLHRPDHGSQRLVSARPNAAAPIRPDAAGSVPVPARRSDPLPAGKPAEFDRLSRLGFDALLPLVRDPA